jgi:hypothetical protein
MEDIRHDPSSIARREAAEDWLKRALIRATYTNDPEGNREKAFLEYRRTRESIRRDYLARAGSR